MLGPFETVIRQLFCQLSRYKLIGMRDLSRKSLQAAMGQLKLIGEGQRINTLSPGNSRPALAYWQGQFIYILDTS